MAAYAYAARYGNQPLSELRRLTRRELAAFNDALGEMIRHENGKPKDGDD